MKPAAILLLTLLSFVTHAQRVVNVDDEGNFSAAQFFITVGGEPLAMAKFVKVVEGTPFYSHDWLLGSLKVYEGKSYKNIRLRLNLYDDAVHYMDDKDREMIANVAISEIHLRSSFGDTIHFYHSNSLNQPSKMHTGWYQLLNNDSVKLYKYHLKEMKESKPYGSATTENRIMTRYLYFVQSKGEWNEIKKPQDLALYYKEYEAQISQLVQSFPKKTSAEEKLMLSVSLINQLTRK